MVCVCVSHGVWHVALTPTSLHPRPCCVRSVTERSRSLLLLIVSRGVGLSVLCSPLTHLLTAAFTSFHRFSCVSVSFVGMTDQFFGVFFSVFLSLTSFITLSMCVSFVGTTRESSFFFLFFSVFFLSLHSSHFPCVLGQLCKKDLLENLYLFSLSLHVITSHVCQLCAVRTTCQSRCVFFFFYC